ncbi:hypothetical protein Pla22_23700 [Rubripirellula amarantea]|uniref:Uncharacterized protein n=1 Tax=Rubripirellula amarantea TaxID=2527999 RepID=A0A5C5WWW4_9BACT|nr:hypothetical protein Pla22_23700 [Rubripirellula amarantea]
MRLLSNILHPEKLDDDTSLDLQNAGCVRTTSQGIEVHPERRATRFDVRGFLDRLAKHQCRIPA